MVVVEPTTPVVFNSKMECENEQIRKHKLNLNGSQHEGYSKQLQYLCSSRPSAKDVSLPKIEIEINHEAFLSRSG